MNVEFFKILVIAIAVVPYNEAYSRRFLKIENCTSTGKTSVVEECSIINNRLNIVLRIFNGTNNAYVR